MGLVQAKQCDVTGSFHKVKQFRFVLTEIIDDTGEAEHVEDWNVYLGPAALDRAIKFIDRGMGPPPKRGDEIPAEDTVTNEDLDTPA